MNKKAQGGLLIAIITAVMLFMAGMLFLGQIMDVVSISRTIGIDCQSNTISDGTKLTCVGIDLVIPILMIAIVSSAVGVILERFML